MKKFLGFLVVVVLLAVGGFVIYLNWENIQSRISGEERFPYEYLDLAYEQGLLSGENAGNSSKENYQNIINDLEREIENPPQVNSDETEELERELVELEQEQHNLRLEYYSARLQLLNERLTLVTNVISILQSQLNAVDSEYAEILANQKINITQLQRMMFLSARRSELLFELLPLEIEGEILVAEIEKTKNQIQEATNDKND
ncbi:MAG: hypothetical protein FWC11_00280 [Firmicutes bacterium]|nr:hypothetical protein [Bacillota bacterium]